jgi:predicted amidophosphoribosyltransferase
MKDPRLELAPGFGKCGECPLKESATYDLCFSCARQTITSLADVEDRCMVCDRPFNKGEDFCRNWLCQAGAERFFRWNYAVALREGPLERAFARYKFEGKAGWATIFARILIGALEAEEGFRGFNRILASPTFVTPGRFDHTRLVIDEAARVASPASGWPFELDAEATIVKTAETPQLSRIRGLGNRIAAAQGPLRNSLLVRHPERIRGQHVLVYDDTFTDGSTLNEVARALRIQGQAETVCGITLCRQPWTRQP